MRYETWETSVPEQIRHDPVWSLRVYRASLFAAELARLDAHALVRVPITAAVASQLVRAVGGVGANIAHGYGHTSAVERAWYYESALGAAREGRDWYLHARPELGDAAALSRIATLSSIARALSGLIHRARRAPCR